MLGSEGVSFCLVALGGAAMLESAPMLLIQNRPRLVEFSRMLIRGHSGKCDLRSDFMYIDQLLRLEAVDPRILAVTGGESLFSYLENTYRWVHLELRRKGAKTGLIGP